MNEGIFLVLMVCATAGAGLTVLWYRDLIWPERFPPAGQRRRPARVKPSRPARVKPSRPATETALKQPETVSAPVSGIAAPQTQAETVSFHTLAKLVRAGVITETLALETACDVKAGSSKAYKAARDKLQTALQELDKMPAP